MHRPVMAVLLSATGCGWFTPAKTIPPPPAYLQCEGGGKLTCYVPVEGGSFLRGAQATAPDGAGYDPDARPDEAPVREHAVASFWILTHEASVNDFSRCETHGICDANEALRDDPLANWGKPGREAHPMNGLTYRGAKQLCTFLGGRLPTELEWEYAARGTDGRRYPWGNTPGCGTARERSDKHWSMAVADPPCQHLGTMEMVELRGTSPFHALGMAGSVLEWVEDPYVADAYAGGTATQDPPALRTLRGGSWLDEDATALRSAARHALPPDTKLPDVGVRCVWANLPVSAPLRREAAPHP